MGDSGQVGYMTPAWWDFKLQAWDKWSSLLHLVLVVWANFQNQKAKKQTLITWWQAKSKDVGHECPSAATNNLAALVWSLYCTEPICSVYPYFCHFSNSVLSIWEGFHKKRSRVLAGRVECMDVLLMLNLSRKGQTRWDESWQRYIFVASVQLEVEIHLNVWGPVLPLTLN